MAASIYRDLFLTGNSGSNKLSYGAPVFAEVVVDIPARQLADKLFTYRVPDYLLSETFIGAQVLVPFGGQELVGGYVMALKQAADGNFKVKDIIDVLDGDPLFDRDYVEFLYWIADYYCASLSSVIAAAVPADIGTRLKRVVELLSKPGPAAGGADADTSHDTVPVATPDCGQLDLLTGSLPPGAPACLIEEDPQAMQVIEALLKAKNHKLSLATARQRSRLTQGQFYRAIARLRQAKLVNIRAETSSRVSPKLVATVVWTGAPGLSERQEKIIAALKRAGGQMPLSRLVEAACTTGATIKKMAAKGLLQLRQEEVLRDPLERISSDATPGKALMPVLTDDQAAVLARLEGELKASLAKQGGTFNEPAYSDPFLLHGVTGSGKTEIYLRLIQKALEAGRSALLLVPEISLTPQLAGRLKARFGYKIAIWHSALSAGERYDTWRRLREGDVRVLLGARSAVLVSMPDLGLVILDEEHDSSYKQSSPQPRYHARRLALEKARRSGAMVLLGSATPDVGTYHTAALGKRLLTLPERVFKQAMPEVCIIDMREEFAAGRRSIFSTRLLAALEQCLCRKEQAILLINRRGYANHVFCRACGHVVKCDYCSVCLVFHQSAHGAYDGHLACHHCGFTAASTTVCPSCLSPYLRQYGLGTQRVEQELKKAIPDARLLRLDADVAASKGAYEQVFDTFSSGKADILIGTQMVAKGLDIPLVTVVGVLAADASFNLPDYRSFERGFQLLTQVAGRAGRGDRPGLVVLQTYDSQLPALRLAKDHDYISFAQEELKVRRQLKYPPFSQVIRVVVAGPEPASVEAACEQLVEELAHFLEEQIPVEMINILGPASCLIERLRGNFRFHFLIKNLAGESGRALIASFFRSKHLSPGLQMAVDVDAFDLL